VAETVLKTEGLTKRYGALTAVRDLSLEVYEGEVFGFLGPNGAGKTTSINMMCGLLKADAGQVWVRGGPRWGAGDEGALQVRQRVGVCPQEIVLWERLTCLEQLQFMGQMYGLSGRRARANGQRLLGELDLAAKANKQARTLSGGMKRRLTLAMALVHEPELAVLDEPEAGLDPQSRVKVREYIQALARSRTARSSSRPTTWTRPSAWRTGWPSSTGVSSWRWTAPRRSRAGSPVPTGARSSRSGSTRSPRPGPGPWPPSTTCGPSTAGPWLPRRT